MIPAPPQQADLAQEQPGTDRLGDQRVLGREPVAHVEDGSPGRQSQRERPHHPAAGGLGPAPGTGPSHSPRFSQPGANARKQSDPMLS